MPRNLITTVGGAALIVLTTVLPSAAQAATVTFATSRTALDGDNSINWQVVGPAFSSAPNPFSVTSSSGLTLTVSKASGEFLRADQTSASDGPFSANFAPGDALIFTGRDAPGSVTIDFSSPVFAAGTQLESAGNGPFNAIIEALDNDGNSLGGFSVSGIAEYGGPGDNTAPFVGVLSDQANIASLRINSEREPGVGFAFNQLDLKTVPEPAVSALSALAFGILLGNRFMQERVSNKGN